MLKLLANLGLFVVWYTGVCLAADFVVIPGIVYLWHKLKGTQPRQLTVEEAQRKRNLMVESNVNLGIFWMLSIIVTHCLQTSGYKLGLGIAAFVAVYFYGEYKGSKDAKRVIESNKRFCRNLRTVDPVTAQEMANEIVFGDDK